MKDLINEIEKYVNYFRKKRKFHISNIEEINKILTSQKYYDYINKVHSYYNLKAHPKENIRLCPQYYIDVNKIIDYFWELLLGNKLYNEFKSSLKLKLKI